MYTNNTIIPFVGNTIVTVIKFKLNFFYTCTKRQDWRSANSNSEDVLVLGLYLASHAVLILLWHPDLEFTGVRN